MLDNSFQIDEAVQLNTCHLSLLWRTRGVVSRSKKATALALFPHFLFVTNVAPLFIRCHNLPRLVLESYLCFVRRNQSTPGFFIPFFDSPTPYNCINLTNAVFSSSSSAATQTCFQTLLVRNITPPPPRGRVRSLCRYTHQTLIYWCAGIKAITKQIFVTFSVVNPPNPVLSRAFVAPYPQCTYDLVPFSFCF